MSKPTPQELWLSRQMDVHSRGPDYSLAPRLTLNYSELIYVPNLLDVISNNLEGKTLLDSLDFNVFKYKKNHSYEHLILLMVSMFQELGLIVDCNIPITRLYRFLKSIGKRYRDVPFHNFYHCFNVTQTLYFFLQGLNCKKIFEPEELLVMMLSAIGHDADHPGLNNKFHKTLKTKMCEQYNSSSVLEHHHFSQAAEILQRKECNILVNFDMDLLLIFNRLIKKSILATDLALHSSLLNEIEVRSDAVRNIFEGKNLECEDDDIITAMMALIKCADISNEIRSKKISSKWAQLVNQEFLSQVNIELEFGLEPFIPLTALQNIPQEQIFFIEKLCLPLYERVAQMFPPLNQCIEQLKNNSNLWKFDVRVEKLNYEDSSTPTSSRTRGSVSNQSGWESAQREGDLHEMLEEEAGDETPKSRPRTKTIRTSTALRKRRKSIV
eukprot:TRINITY_DN3334_c0_g1_i1.p1 TRINITY_DN3334_c0_g1~~TRINITY_DN3334_c0_g1_i1.p1  ORF type:complete len:489 (+),score=96.95 TRINITY_DN3334_c0_g1_i1:153-1469(+)